MHIQYNKNMILAISLSVFYFLVCTLLIQEFVYIIPNFLMCILIFIGFTFIFNNQKGLLTIKNFFFFLFYVVGIYLRYVYTLLNINELMSFTSYATREATIVGHAKTIFAILFFTVFFIVGNSKLSKLHPIVHVPEKPPLNGWVVIIYFVFSVAYIIYSLTHIRLATIQDFGIYDNLFNNIAYFNRLVAYMYLILYTETKKKKDFLMYAFFIVPYVIISLISLYKGTIMLEIIIFIVIATKKNKIKVKQLLIPVIAFFLIFPLISMLRVNNNISDRYTVNLNGILEYYKENNLIDYISYRFQYYDETYFVVNTDQEDLNSFREGINNPVVAFAINVIPRALWYNKPSGTMSYSITHNLCKIPTAFITNVTIGEIGEAYIYGGYLGMAIFAFIHGWLFRRLEDLLESSNSIMTFSAYAVFGCVLMNFSEGLVVGKYVIIISLYIIYSALRVVQDMKSK